MMHDRTTVIESTLKCTYDICVIGGGATGSGCALDAQLRGLKTILIEAGDFASGTSSASTKLVHGGVRYLRQAVTKFDIGQFRVVRSALRERALMIQNAPYLARPLQIVIPCTTPFELPYYGFGLKLYDWISGRANLRSSRVAGRAATMRRIPMLSDERRLAGSVSFTDGQFDDARYNIALVQTFREAGGHAINHARILGFGQGSDDKLNSADAMDLTSGKQFRIGARLFINATGPFADSIRMMANTGSKPRLRLSKGVHLLFPLGDFEGHDALMIPKTEDNRLVFVIPWLGRLLVGTTDTEAHADDKLEVTLDEAEYLLRQVNPYLKSPLRLDQVLGGFAGLRPLVSALVGRNTNKLIRDHEVEIDESSGLISILGGKWTTYRAMAQETIDAAQTQLNLKVSACPTPAYGLVGATGFTPELWSELVEEVGITEPTARHLASKYGFVAKQVLALAASEPELVEQVVPDHPAIKAEIVFSILNEMAQSIEDILARRIGIQFYSWTSAIEAAPIAASYLARELSWSQEQTSAAISEYVSKLVGMQTCLGREEQTLGSVVGSR